MGMKTSVLMSVYRNDQPEHLRLALQSIYDDQTLKPDEIVVVFDGPLTEELYRVLDEFHVGKESFVFYHPLEKNVGLGEALRIGTECCTGDYIFRMDADDISDACRFEKQMDYIAAHPECDVVGTDIAEFQTSPDEPDMRRRVCPSDHAGIMKMAQHRNPMNHVTAAIKKEALLRCGGYLSLPLVEDYYLWVRMLAQGCVFYNIHESLVYVRIGNGFLEKRRRNERIKSWRILQQFMLDHKMISQLTAWANMAYIYLFTMMPSGIKDRIYKGFLRK